MISQSSYLNNQCKIIYLLLHSYKLKILLFKVHILINLAYAYRQTTIPYRWNTKRYHISLTFCTGFLNMNIWYWETISKNWSSNCHFLRFLSKFLSNMITIMLLLDECTITPNKKSFLHSSSWLSRLKTTSIVFRLHIFYSSLLKDTRWFKTFFLSFIFSCFVRNLNAFSPGACRVPEANSSLPNSLYWVGRGT